MKKILYAIMVTLLITFVTTPRITAQDHTRWGLPDDVIARFGKGNITGNITYSPDGSKVAFPCIIGIWIYDAKTGEELDLYTGHTDSVCSVAFSPDGKKLVTLGEIKRNQLFQNYPNPFNPETWIPYQLASPANVSISIWTEDGKLIRTLDLGDKPIGIYQDHDRAAFWDGKNKNGEKIASGVYFYPLTAGNFTATRKMLIQK